MRDRVQDERRELSLRIEELEHQIRDKAQRAAEAEERVESLTRTLADLRVKGAEADTLVTTL